MRYKWLIITGCLVSLVGTVYALDPEKEASKPDSHRAGWDAGHQTAAKSDAASCRMCHKSYFCIDCHQRRDSITQRVHRRNFKFYHSIEARTNPRKCDSCHRVSFCTDCHGNPQ